MPNSSDSIHKFDKLRQKAEDLVAQHPGDEPHRLKGVLGLIQELKIHQAELEIQNEELKRAQQELHDLYRNFEDLYELAPSGYLNLSPKGLITRINLAGVTLFNGVRQRLLKTGLTQYVTPGWQDRYLSALRTAGQTGQKQGLELQLKGAQDVPCWVWADILADLTDDDEVIQWRITLVDITAKKAIESSLMASEEKYRLLFNEMVSGASLLEISERDRQGSPIEARILEVNAAFERMTGVSSDEVVGRCVRELWPQTEAFWFDLLDRAVRTHQAAHMEGFHKELGKHLLVSAFKVDDARIGITFIDISAHKKIEETLDKARRELESRVIKRTTELSRANLNLQDEILSRRKIQNDLQKKSEELIVHSSDLVEANIALKVLLRERERERLKLEEKVISNLNELTRPHLDKMAAGKLSPRQKTMLDAVNKSLDDIASPLSRRFIIDGSHLTPSETRVANLIRQGSATKEIAELMGVASSTVDFHRLNIRRKLKLTKKQVNLQSYLKGLR